MGKRILIDPVTRIEGHAKITIHLNDQGEVESARFHVTEFRGFEKFCEGRTVWEMPGITSRICGICPVSHLIASAKAGDDILAVSIPDAAVKLRRLANLGQLIQSHALSFFHLSAPDLLLGMDAPPEKRNVMGLIEAYPDLARRGIRLRKFGQEVIETLGGKRIHSAWFVPGGAQTPMTAEGRNRLLAYYPEAVETTRQAIDLIKRYHEENQAIIANFGDFPSLFLGLVNADGNLEHYDGKIRIVDSTGNKVADGLDPKKYAEFIGEASESASYLKFPYYKPMGYPDGVYRVGPLARLNICDAAGTPLADKELENFRQLGASSGAVTSSFYYHYARLIEILYAIERVEQLLNDPQILDSRVRAHADPNRLEGIGVSEAPRGTLFHHYHIDENGILQKINLLIATGQNNLAMNKTVLQVAKQYVKGNRLTEGMLNRVEAGIRCFDPCLSCSTHAIGQMPLVVQLVGPDGTTLDELKRDA